MYPVNLSSITFYRSFISETLKVKKTALLWVSIMGAFAMAGLIFIIHLARVTEFVGPIGANPWVAYLNFSLPIIEIFLIPYIVLICSSIAFYEHQGQAWKLLYTLPIKKVNFYFSKLLLALFLLVGAYILFALLTYCSGMILGFIFPSFEFHYYPPEWINIVRVIARSFISALAILALQFWISIRWKNYVIPVGIGLLGYIFGLSIAGAFKWAQFIPYCAPIYVGRLMGGQSAESMDMTLFAGLGNVEWYSLIGFLIFSILGFLEQKYRNVK